MAFKKIDRKISYNYFCEIIFVVLALSLGFYGYSFAWDVSGYAWGENIGWIDFGTNEGNVDLSSSTFSGYAWAENLGWINLQPNFGGVINDGQGNLSGYAWGENVGWINFSPTYGGITVDCLTGDFSGYAWGENVGWVVFNCQTTDSCAVVDYKVNSNWRCSPGHSDGPVPSPPGPSPTSPQPTPTPEEPQPSPETSPETSPSPSETPQPSAPPGPEETTPPAPPLPPGDILPFPTMPPFILDSIKEISINIKEATDNIREIPEVKKIIKNPAVDTVTKSVEIVSTGLTIAVGLQGIVPLAANVFDFTLLPLRIRALFLPFGFRRRKYWGTVYDSTTKQPLDPAFVFLKNDKGEEIKTQITDLNGRFGFLVDTGEYYLESRKTHYRFPSEKIKADHDEIYDNLYFGTPIKIKKDDVVMTNIPMDSLGFDWNEIAKKKYIKFNYYREVFKRWFPDFMFFLGLILSVATCFLKPTTFNQIILLAFLGLLILRYVGFKGKAWRLVLAEDNGVKKPLSFAILKLFFKGTSAPVIRKTVTDVNGRYYLLTDPGEYDVVIEKKIGDTYQVVKKLEGVKIKRGLLNIDIVV